MLDGSSLVWVLVLGAVAGQGQYPATLGKENPFKGADQGNWTVKDCIIARMAAQVKIYPIPSNETSIMVDVPINATADGQCVPVDNSTQILWLRWTEAQASNKSIILNRNATITFSKNMTSNTYGVQKMEMVYETRQYDKQVKNGTNTTLVWTTEYVSMTTYAFANTQFSTPLNRSYLCSDVGTIDLEARLDDTTTPASQNGIKLKNATVSATKVQLDAFRASTAIHDQFQIPLDCAFHPNDVVPIIVGCALAGLVVLVLIAYLVGRRKSRARGYQSV
jgi:lysosomal-associated membrane protein 1/2